MNQSPQPPSQRRIEASGTGRLTFRPGKKHPLDAQMKEALATRNILEEQLRLFTQDLQALAPFQDLAARLEVADKARRHFLAAHYRDYFYQDCH